ncbi:MAG: DUF2730 domain-containing protein [Rhodobacteraceae bacterium]|nr:DUF2730 domain-containing protein [Paracoccaceae bacterium]MCW9041727.1 DUF2730 domain-containing protein [Pseudopelagicola sp.]
MTRVLLLIGMIALYVLLLVFFPVWPAQAVEAGAVIPFDPTISVSVLLSVGTIIFTIFKTRARALDDRFDVLNERLKDGSKRMDRHDGRLGAIEQTVQSLPAQSDMHNLQLRLAEMSGDLKAINASMEGNGKIMERLETIVSRHEDHLLEGGRK